MKTVDQKCKREREPNGMAENMYMHRQDIKLIKKNNEKKKKRHEEEREKNTKRAAEEATAASTASAPAEKKICEW